MCVGFLKMQVLYVLVEVFKRVLVLNQLLAVIWTFGLVRAVGELSSMDLSLVLISSNFKFIL